MAEAPAANRKTPISKGTIDESIVFFVITYPESVVKVTEAEIISFESDTTSLTLCRNVIFELLFWEFRLTFKVSNY